MRYNVVKDASSTISSSSYIVKNPENYKGKWNELFSNNNPIMLELGMGRGSFIIGMAMKYPNLNFIGLELDKNQYTKMLFEQQIKDMKYNVISITRQAPKYDRTHKDEDRYILEDVKVKARQVWIVMNPFKSFKCFKSS